MLASFVDSQNPYLPNKSKVITVFQRPEKVFDPLELGLLVVMSHPMVVLRAKPGSSTRALTTEPLLQLLVFFFSLSYRRVNFLPAEGFL